MGNIPKPTALKRFEGNPGKRKLPENEPQYPARLPQQPTRMSAAAKRVWAELLDEMGGIGMLRRIDKRALAQLCEDEAALERAYDGLWKMAAQLKEKAKREGKVLPGGEILGLLSTNTGRASMRVIRDLGRGLILQRREFGLTPSARTRIMVEARDRAAQDFIDDAVFNRPAELLLLPKSG
ncbi:MAG TPA: P27 family phage terminase small subunit [Acidobacteriaceae bacterium]|jgi:P27 family predicted phage terminase small subunit